MDNLESKEPIIEDIVKDYLGLVYSFVFRLTSNDGDASDITQEVFVKVWKNLGKFKSGQSLKAWILTIARNTAIDWLRKKKPILFSQLNRVDEDGDLRFEDNIKDKELLPDEVFAQGEMRAKLEKALGQLPLNQREVFLLHQEEGLTFEEIAKLVGRPMNTVKSQYRRALIALRQYLAKSS